METNSSAAEGLMYKSVFQGEHDELEQQCAK